MTSEWDMTNHRKPQDFAQIRMASGKSCQELDFSAIPRGNGSWGRNRGKLQLVGGSRPGASWSLLLNLPLVCVNPSARRVDPDSASAHRVGPSEMISVSLQTLIGTATPSWQST